MSEEPIIHARTRKIPVSALAIEVDPAGGVGIEHRGHAPRTDIGNAREPENYASQQRRGTSPKKAKTKKTASDDYEVGYGKPPKHSRWLPGQCGNKNGRPKKSKNRKTMVRDVVGRQTKVQRDGKSVKMPRLEVMYELLCQKALQGNIKALLEIDKLWRETQEVGETDQDDGVSVNVDASPISDTDLKAYAHYQAERLRAAGFDEDGVARALRAMGMVRPDAPGDDAE